MRNFLSKKRNDREDKVAPQSPPSSRLSRMMVTNPFTDQNIMVNVGERETVQFSKQIEVFVSDDIVQVKEEVNKFCQHINGTQDPQISIKKEGDDYIGTVEYIKITIA